MNTAGSEDAAQRRREFARRAGLDDEASSIFAERQGNYRRGVPSVPPAYRRIAEGSVIMIGGREWRVLIGEGHAPEHACLFCEEAGVLIAGDQILPKISPNISVQAYEPDGDPLARYLANGVSETPGLTLGQPQPGWAVACGLCNAPTAR